MKRKRSRVQDANPTVSENNSRRVALLLSFAPDYVMKFTRPPGECGFFRQVTRAPKELIGMLNAGDS